MTAEESLHETYLKSKRYLVFFSGTLLLSVFVGFAATDQDALLGWKISDPQLVSVVIYFAVGYYLAQRALFWDAQPEPAKVRLQHSFDYWLSVGIGFIALYSLPVRLLMRLYGGFAIEGVEPGDLLGDPLTPLLLLVLPPACALPYQFFLRPGIKKSAEDADTRSFELTHTLVGPPRRMVFNPMLYSRTAGGQGSKIIKFGADGSIGGGNTNEHAWRANAGFLEILNAEGKLYSRFKLTSDGRQLHHTNDSDTRSLRNQYMDLLSDPDPSDD